MKNEMFLPLFDNIVQGMMNGEVLTPNGDKYRKATITNQYKRCRIELQEFEGKFGQIAVKQLNVRFGEKFKAFLVSKGLAKNTIGNRLATLKAIIRRLYFEEKTTFTGTGIRAGGEETTSVYNTIDELRFLSNFDLESFPGLDRIRDVYILHCFLGLRVGDLRILLANPKLFIVEDNGKTFFEIKNQKTGEVVTIPIGKIAEGILEKRQYDFGKPFSCQYYNHTIKRLGKYLGLQKEILHSITKGGERVDNVRQKWQLMSSHTARRTFATNAYLAGVPVLAIMKIT